MSRDYFDLKILLNLIEESNNMRRLTREELHKLKDFITQGRIPSEMSIVQLLSVLNENHVLNTDRIPSKITCSAEINVGAEGWRKCELYNGHCESHTADFNTESNAKIVW